MSHTREDRKIRVISCPDCDEEIELPKSQLGGFSRVWCTSCGTQIPLSQDKSLPSRA
jgi:uncharacterized paraquat-inducible protein A